MILIHLIFVSLSLVAAKDDFLFFIADRISLKSLFLLHLPDYLRILSKLNRINTGLFILNAFDVLFNQRLD